ncbi:chorismate mutase [Amycolatopsis sp. cmx-11-51]|uniref:chorismate mutase n=1 Tax=Amycolatopsis sp. cmx-11-51 TaxID=2785797 RepID=UPI0039E44022
MSIFAVVLLLVGLPAPASASSGSWTLTEPAAQRVRIADKVAAAKFGTPSPIDDPVREQQILDSVAAKAPGLGLDSGGVVRFFRDQIEANKVCSGACTGGGPRPPVRGRPDDPIWRPRSGR